MMRMADKREGICNRRAGWCFSPMYDDTHTHTQTQKGFMMDGGQTGLAWGKTKGLMLGTMLYAAYVQSTGT